MSHAPSGDASPVRYEPPDKPPHLLSFGMAAQFVTVTIAGIVLTPLIVIRAADQSDSYLSWAVFAALLVAGLTTILQAVRVGRFGAGYVLLMGTSGAFIAVCITALTEGGPALLATLVVASSLFQFLLASRLSLLRRIITPPVAGTVIMLISVTIMPILFDMMSQVQESGSAFADWLSRALGNPSGAFGAGVTMAVIVAIVLRGSGVWRLWAPVIGVIAGSLASGLYDVGAVASAAWFGLPGRTWAGLDLGFGPEFWVLLPAFIFVTLVGAIETIGDSVAIQNVSWRRPRATDYRAVQGAVAADGVGNLLSGLAATVPNTTYSSSVSVTEVTGVAARRVGVFIGAIFIVLAFSPKATSVLLAIPDAVIGAYGLVLMAILFIVGMRIAVKDGLDLRQGIVVGVSFWIGAGFQANAIFPDLWSDRMASLLGNGMTAGGFTALALSAFFELTRPRRKRLAVGLDMDSLTQIKEFVTAYASKQGWDELAADRMCLVAEETLVTLTEQKKEREDAVWGKLVVVVGADGDDVEMEFMASIGDSNIQDRMALLADRPAEGPAEREMSLRLLRHLASSVRHQQYTDGDIVKVRLRVAGPRAGEAAA